MHMVLLNLKRSSMRFWFLNERRQPLGGALRESIVPLTHMPMSILVCPRHALKGFGWGLRPTRDYVSHWYEVWRLRINRTLRKQT
jgi:hypothetical protein